MHAKKAIESCHELELIKIVMETFKDILNREEIYTFLRHVKNGDDPIDALGKTLKMDKLKGNK